MNKTEKQELIDQLKSDFSKAQFVALANFKGVTVESITKFRAKVRNTNAAFKVAKNTLINISAKDSDFGKFTQDLQGPNGVIFGFEDAVAIAKVIDTFSKEEEKFSVNKAIFEGRELSKEQLKALSSLPSKEVLLGQLLSVMNGPARSFVSVLAAVPRSFVTVLDAIAKQKENQG